MYVDGLIGHEQRLPLKGLLGENRVIEQLRRLYVLLFDNKVVVSHISLGRCFINSLKYLDAHRIFVMRKAYDQITPSCEL